MQRSALFVQTHGERKAAKAKSKALSYSGCGQQLTTGLSSGTAALLLDIQLGLVGAAAAWGPRPWASWKRIMGMPYGSPHRGALATGPPRTLTHTRMHTRGIPYANMKCSCLAWQSPLKAKRFFSASDGKEHAACYSRLVCKWLHADCFVC